MVYIQISFKITYFISHEKGLGRAKMLCPSPLPTTFKLRLETHLYNTTCLFLFVQNHNEVNFEYGLLRRKKEKISNQ